MPVSSSESPALAAFRYPNFRYYMTARFLITASSEMQSVGVAWQIYGIRHFGACEKLTRSAFRE